MAKDPLPSVTDNWTEITPDQAQGVIGAIQSGEWGASQSLPLLSSSDQRPVFGSGGASEIAELSARVSRLERLVDRLLSGAE